MCNVTFCRLRALAIAAALFCAVVPAVASAQPRLPTAEQQREVDRLTTDYQAQSMRLDYKSAVVSARQLWTLAQKIYGAEDEAAERYKNLTAVALQSSGQHVEALELFHQLTTTAAKNHGPESREVETLLVQTGMLLQAMQRWDDLDANHHRLLAIKKKLDGERSHAYADALGSYAGFLQVRTQNAAARQYYEQQIQIVEQLPGGQSDLGLPTSLFALGRLYWENQQQAKAIAAFERALVISERVPAAQVIIHGGMLVAVAMHYRFNGRTDLSMPLEKRARTLYTQEIARLEKSKPDDQTIASLLGSLANLQWWTEDLAGADQTFTRSIALDHKYGRTSWYVATFAMLKRLEGKPKEALTLIDQAEADYAKSSPGKSVFASMRADMYGDLGDYPRAQDELQKFLGELAISHGKNSPEYSAGLLRLAIYDLRRGSATDAEPRLREGLEVAEQELIQITKTGIESDHYSWFRRNSHQLDLAITYHVQYAPKSASAARLAVTTLLRRKGRGLDSVAANLATIRAKLAPADRHELDALAEARGQLARRKVVGPADDAAAFAKDVAALEERIQGLELKLSQKSAQYRSLGLPIELAAVQQLIPAGTSLVEIVNHAPFELAPPILYTVKPKPVTRRYLAYVVGHTGDPVAVDLGPAEAIDQAVAALRKALANPKDDHAIPLGRALYDLTFAKLVPQLGSSTDVLLAPDGTLNLVPFAALVDEQQAFLVKRFTFTYLTSGRDLLRHTVQAKGKKNSDVIFADPQFEGSAPADESTSRGSRSVDLSSVSWPQLPGTRQEAEQVTKTMKKFKLYAGAEATESQLKQLHGPRILHLATHGFFLRDKAPKASRGLPAGAPAPTVAEENPLLRSGIVLAGANELNSGNEDGILTALEASGLDLWGTKLVVLSACQTGDGKVVNGDGVYGLRRAFVIAGAEGLVMSLWQVNDFATRDLMVGFYRQLHKGRARSSALRDIQLELLAKPEYAHPYFWASFVPAGENTPIKH